MIIILLLLSCGLFQTGFSQCWQRDDVFVDGLCYTVSNTKEKFSYAENVCNSKTQDFGIVQTLKQANTLANLVRSKSGEPNGKFWIGLSREALNARFHWDDGTPLYWTNFDPNFNQDNLYVAESTANGKWQQLDGRDYLYFVCSYDPKNTPSTTRQPGSTTTYYPWSTTGFPDVSTTYHPWSTDYPGTTYYPDSTFYPSGSTNFPTGWTDYPGGSTTYSPAGTTGYPVSGSTYFPEGSRFNRVQNAMKKLLKK